MGVKVELPTPRRGEISPFALQTQAPSTDAQLQNGKDNTVQNRWMVNRWMFDGKQKQLSTMKKQGIPQKSIWFFTTALLRHNLDTQDSPISNVYSSCFQYIYSAVQPSHNKLQNIFIIPKETLYPLATLQLSPPHLPTSPQQSLIYFLSL